MMIRTVLALGLAGFVLSPAAALEPNPQERRAGEACPAAEPPPSRLPPKALERLRQSIQDAQPHPLHAWRDMPALHDDGTVNVFVEIPQGSSTKLEFDMKKNALEPDRTVPESLGGYPTGYGFIPQTIGVDGDPFDGLVLGEETQAATIVRGHVLGIMHMTDEKGHDAKILVTAEPDPLKREALLAPAERARIGRFFNRYKAEDDDEETWACVSGWGGPEEARRYLAAAHRLFAEARR